MEPLFGSDELYENRRSARWEGLLDVHIVTAEDIFKEDNLCSKEIGAIADPARPIPMKTGGE